ncbi:MAG: LysR family transcriptional regulator [Pseudomonadota bacterium]
MSKPLDRLTLLETFARICDRGSISAAARDLGLSQASASRQLKELEDRLGIQLIRRTTHSLALTRSGQELLRDARELLADWDALEERHAGGDGTVRGPLKVVAPVALGQLHLADIALDYQLQHPLVSLTWELEDHAIRFAETGCDCWIKIGPVPDETLIVRQVGAVERLVVATPDLVASRTIGTPDAVAALPFVSLSPFEGGRIGLTSASGERTEITPQIRVATNNIFAVHRAVLKGVGAAVLPRWFVDADLSEGRLVDVMPEWRAARLSIHAAHLPARHQPRRLSLFLEAIARAVPRIPGIE